MAIKQLSKLKKGHIVAYNECGLSTCDITKKLPSIYASHKNYQKTSSYHLFCLVLWHINQCRLFHFKSCLYIYIYIKYMICKYIYRKHF